MPFILLTHHFFRIFRGDLVSKMAEANAGDEGKAPLCFVSMEDLKKQIKIDTDKVWLLCEGFVENGPWCNNVGEKCRELLSQGNEALHPCDSQGVPDEEMAYVKYMCHRDLLRTLHSKGRDVGSQDKWMLSASHRDGIDNTCQWLRESLERRYSKLETDHLGVLMLPNVGTGETTKFFKIVADWSGKVLDAIPNFTGDVCSGSSGEVHLWEYHGGHNQLWYWDGPEKDILRNKMFSNKVRYFNILRFKDFGF